MAAEDTDLGATRLTDLKVVLDQQAAPGHRVSCSAIGSGAG
jgi:hypothetical protein